MITAQRKAYTMIELIFVIVIIGILAAVIIPKMAINRDDAKASNITQNLAICIGDASTFYLKEGVFDNGIISGACDVTINQNACFTVTPNNGTGILNVKHNGTATMCTKAHTIVERNGLSSATGIDHQF